MKVKDFFKDVHGSELPAKDIMEHEVVVRIYNSDGVFITENITLEKCNYMFSPWRTNDDGTKGSMVLEIKLNS